MYTIAHTGFSFVIYAVLAALALISGLLVKFRNRGQQRDESND